MKNIVVGIDFSHNSVNAMKHAVAVTIRLKAQLHLIWVKTPGVSEVVKKNKSKYSKVVEEKLEELLVDARREAPACQIQSVILEGKPAVEICKYANNLKEPIIFVGVRGISGFEEKYIGSNTSRILAMTTCPVIVIKEDTHIGRDLTQLLVPIDTSFETLQKMKYAIRFAKGFIAKLLLLGAYTSNSREEKHTINIQLNHAEKMCEKANIRFATKTVMLKENLCKELVDYAETADVNLMVIMREEEGDLSDFWIGNTTRRILSMCAVPLLIIPNVNHFNISK